MTDHSAGILPALDQNAPPRGVPAESGDPVALPDFIIQLQQKLADLRNELSDMMAARYGEMACTPMAGSPKSSVSSIQKDAENKLKRYKLECEEEAIEAQLSNYLSAGTLGDSGESE
jgi:hypothetical protein